MYQLWGIDRCVWSQTCEVVMIRFCFLNMVSNSFLLLLGGHLLLEAMHLLLVAY